MSNEQPAEVCMMAGAPIVHKCSTLSRLPPRQYEQVAGLFPNLF